MGKASTDKRKSQVSGRARRRIEEEKSRKRRIYTIVGAGISAVLVFLLGLFLITRDDNGDSDQLPVIAITSEITAPTDGRIAGDPAAPLAVVEWGDYQ